MKRGRGNPQSYDSKALFPLGSVVIPSKGLWSWVPGFGAWSTNSWRCESRAVEWWPPHKLCLHPNPGTHRTYNGKSQQECELWALSDYDASVWVHWLWQVRDTGGGAGGRGSQACVREGVNGNSPYLPFNFPANGKLLKTSQIFEKVN